MDGPATFPQSRYETMVREGTIEAKATEENVQKRWASNFMNDYVDPEWANAALLTIDTQQDFDPGGRPQRSRARGRSCPRCSD